MIPSPLRSTLFPYTTLFRSTRTFTGIPSINENTIKKLPLYSETLTGKTMEPINFIYIGSAQQRSEEHTSELQSLRHLVCRLLLEKKKTKKKIQNKYQNKQTI